MLTLAVKLTLLLAAAALAALALRRAPAAARHLVWLAALAAALLLPAASFVTPVWQPPLPAAVTTAVSSADRIVIDVIAGGGLPWSPLLAMLWGLGAIVLLARFAFAYRAAGRVSRDARLWRFTGGTPILCTTAVNVPLVCGLWRPSIVLPAAAPDWPADRLRVVLQHEGMHIRRRDTLTQAMAQLACVLYWPHPLVWWAASQLRQECEQAADDGVLAAGETAAAYAGHLFEIARGLATARRTFEGEIAMARISELESRLRALITTGRSRSAARPGWVAAAALAAAVLLVPLASLRAPAQPAGAAIAGVVRDASGAVVPKANVIVSLPGTNRKEFTITGATGEFLFAPLPEGSYNINVEKPGFALSKLEGVQATAAVPVRLEITLAIGGIREQLTVTAGSGVPAPPAPDATRSGTPKRISVGGSVQAARMVTQARPVYPPECKAERVEGTVLLRAVVGTDGAPLSLEPINQLVDKRLVDAATAAVKQWRYQPTLLNGQPVEVITEVQVNFRLQ